MKRKIALAALALTLVACSPLDVISGVFGGGGVDATAQVAEEANKGTIAVQAGTKSGVGDVQGDSIIMNNSSAGMLGMAALGMFPFVLLCFYLLPAPKWVHKMLDKRRSHKE